MNFIRSILAIPHIWGRALLALFFIAMLAGSYFIGSCNGQKTGYPEGYKKGYDAGRDDCPKPTKIPDAVEKWRKK